MTVVVPAWGKKLVIDNISKKNPTPRFQMNGSTIKFPYQYSKLRNHIEDFIKISYPNRRYQDTFVIEISFGLKISIYINDNGARNIDIP